MGFSGLKRIQARLDQFTYDFQVPVLGRKHQGIASILRYGLYIGSGLDQGSHALDVASCGREEKRCVSFLVANVDWGPATNELTHSVKLPLKRENVQESASLRNVLSNLRGKFRHRCRRFQLDGNPPCSDLLDHSAHNSIVSRISLGALSRIHDEDVGSESRERIQLAPKTFERQLHSLRSPRAQGVNCTVIANP
jgi:hypothetical protein